MLESLLPDITTNSHSLSPSRLHWVGMENIAIPITIATENNTQRISAKAGVYVSLNTPSVKGIHMSRLYLLINQLVQRPLLREDINSLLVEMIDSQKGISKEAKITLSFDLLIEKYALLSDESGYQAYPVTITAESIKGEHHYQLDLTIPYSSTCPCSASLAQQLQTAAIDQAFPESAINKGALLEWANSKDGLVATPHSQRSYAYLRLQLKQAHDLPNLTTTINALEETIQTPVQTAVKRVDEQAFARLNAENLMFCEDAARKIKAGLQQMSFVNEYWFKVEHQESLHAHNAVVVDQSEGWV